MKIIGIGEALWDLLPAGPQLGGAPANFAYHARCLGAHASVVTRVGSDDWGRDILVRFKEFGFPEESVQVDADVPTGTVAVKLSAEGQPQFAINEGAWDRIVLTDAALKAVATADAICFGSLAQRHKISRTAIQLLVAAAPAAALRIFDINLRQHFYSQEIIDQSLKLANVLKLNDSELPIVAAMLGLEGTTADQLNKLARLYELRLVALTRGGLGSLLYSEGQWSDHPGLPAKVKDAIGAGDAFTAAVAMGLLRKMNLQEIHQRASELAAYVCSQDGATPPLPEHLQNSFRAQ